MIAHKIGTGEYFLGGEASLILHSPELILGCDVEADHSPFSIWFKTIIDKFDPYHKATYFGTAMTLCIGESFIEALQSRSGRLICMPPSGSYTSKHFEHRDNAQRLQSGKNHLRFNYLLASNKEFNNYLADSKNEKRSFSAHMFYLVFELDGMSMIISTTYKGGVGRIDTTIVAYDININHEIGFFESLWSWCGSNASPTAVLDASMHDGRCAHIATPIWKDSDRIVLSSINSMLPSLEAGAWAEVSVNSHSDCPAMPIIATASATEKMIYCNKFNLGTMLPNDIWEKCPIRTVKLLHSKMIITSTSFCQLSCNLGRRQMVFQKEIDRHYGESYRMDCINSISISIQMKHILGLL